MKKLTHIKFFSAHNREEVYETFQDHYNRDTIIHMLWDIAFMFCAVGAIFIGDHADWLWLFGGIYTAERKLSRYIDNSNRNWTMHVIDYLESRKDKSI